MPSITTMQASEAPAEEQVEALLDRAIELLVSPTLENLRAVEEVLREAVVRMPDPAHAAESGPERQPPAAEDAAVTAIARKVRMCGRLLASAEAARPGFEPPAAAYTAQGAAEVRRLRHHLDYEV